MTVHRLTRLSATNPFDQIDAFVLVDGDETFDLEYREENFPDGSRPAAISFPRQLFDPAAFEITDLGPYVVVVRR